MKVPENEDLAGWSGEFVLDNDPSGIAQVISLLQQQSLTSGFGERTAACLGIAIEEALLNGIHHGNLEVASELRDHDLDAFSDLIEQRRRQSPYCERRVKLSAEFSADEVVILVRDEGHGFSLADVPDPRQPDNLQRIGGRGILLMRQYMDDVQYNEKGNEVRLVKRR